MKDFNEFGEFLLKDCRHEINELGTIPGDAFPDEDFEAIGMSPEALGRLMKLVSITTSQTVMLMLRRYHEWSARFSDSNC